MCVTLLVVLSSVLSTRVDYWVEQLSRSNFIRTRNYVERALDRAARLGLQTFQVPEFLPRAFLESRHMLHAVVSVCVAIHVFVPSMQCVRTTTR